MKPSSDKIFPTTLTGGLLEPVLLPVPLRGDLIHVIVTTDEPDLSCLEKSFRTHPPDLFWYGHGKPYSIDIISRQYTGGSKPRMLSKSQIWMRRTCLLLTKKQDFRPGCYGVKYKEFVKE